MIYYRQARRYGLVLFLILIASTGIVVRVNSSSAVGTGIHLFSVIVALLAGIGALLTRRFRPALDCGLLVLAAASFSIAIGLLDGPARVFSAFELVGALLSSTAVLFLSAEVSANTSATRLRR